MHAAILCFQARLEQDDSEAFRNVAACRAVFHNRVAEVCYTRTGTASPVVDSAGQVVVTESEQTDRAV